MPKHALVDPADEEVRPRLPVKSWPHVVLVPGCADQARLPTFHPFQSKLAPLALQVAVEVGRVDVVG